MEGSLDSIRYNPTANYSKRRHNTEPGSRLGEWDKELIQDIFWEEDVRNILAIPLNMGSEDFAAWHFDPRGIFTVKSAYHYSRGSARASSVSTNGRILVGCCSHGEPGLGEAMASTLFPEGEALPLAFCPQYPATAHEH